MTNPKLREMLEEMFAEEIGPPVGNPEWLAKHGPRLQKRRNQTAEKWADAALAVFTQYLQEPDVVERAARAIANDLSRQDGEDIVMPCDWDLRLPWIDQGETDFGQLSIAALNAIKDM